MKHEGGWVSLPKPWLEPRQGLREEVAASAAGIHTSDGGCSRRPLGSGKSCGLGTATMLMS